jgi:hypothetical protein
MEVMVWNTVLSVSLGLIGWILKEKSAEVHRLQVLINRTREEMAKEYVTRDQLHTDINRVLDRLDRLELKLDRLMETKNAS